MSKGGVLEDKPFIAAIQRQGFALCSRRIISKMFIMLDFRKVKPRKPKNNNDDNAKGYTNTNKRTSADTKQQEGGNNKKKKRKKKKKQQRGGAGAGDGSEDQGLFLAPCL
eukprot:CAMPEP_0170172010 /NCGR_PEP_ID=MMETSP0040_2-20121228/5225_1 /TAXON_ID=641309 /ORGANISM="Lotharella oceanica, Strain CCMP622" /LENGTH=109 /DNA_ID=CAMNT_0010412413 /DNA_START=63 /DNA_END=392 /DNA_ORIENTATION=-